MQFPSSAKPSNCAVSLQRLPQLIAVSLLVGACLLSLQRGACAKPPSFEFLLKGRHTSLFKDDNPCYLDGKVQELCQRCAKTTKSNDVYPMCCQDQEAVREWCDKYLHYGA